MTDLLTRLASRAVGEGLHVRPRARPAFGGAEATDGDATPDLRRNSARAAAMLRDPRDDTAQAPHRDAAERDAASEHGDARLEARADGGAEPASDLADAPGDARAPHMAPAPFEPPPRAVERDAQPPEPAPSAALARTPSSDVLDTEGEAHASARALVFASTVHPAARPGPRTPRAAASAVPAMPGAQLADISTETPYADDALAESESAFVPHVRTRAPGSESRAAVRLGAAPQAHATPSHSAPREEPIVHVTIGRVEIRASVPPAPASPRPAPVRPQPLSLNDYLAGRKGGSR